MSFLFGKKSKGDKAGAAPPTRDGPPSAASGTSIPNANGIRTKERGPGVSSPAPGPAVNNLDGNITPSPDQNHEKPGSEHDMQVCFRKPVDRLEASPLSGPEIPPQASLNRLVGLTYIRCSSSSSNSMACQLGLAQQARPPASTQLLCTPGRKDA